MRTRVIHALQQFYWMFCVHSVMSPERLRRAGLI